MNCVELGRVHYRRALELQQDHVDRRLRGEIGDTLLVLEHPPVVVTGRAGGRRNLLLAPQKLAARGIDLAESNRGGDVTFHCPGQLVAYPIVDLGAAGRDLHEYLRKLEEIVIRLLADFGLAAVRKPGMTGVFAGGAKIASIGVAVRRWVAYHGFALNVNNDLAGFSFIRPCGFEGLAVTSLSRALGREVAPSALIPALFRRARDVLSKAGPSESGVAGCRSAKMLPGRQADLHGAPGVGNQAY